MSDINSANEELLADIFGEDVDAIFAYSNGFDSEDESLAEDSDDATASFDADDILWMSTTDNTEDEDDTYVGDHGDDDLFAGSGDDTVSGGFGDDDIFGEAGNDALYGGTGNDELFGGTGDDFLRGDGGTNTLNGGDGLDTAVYLSAYDADFVTAIEPGVFTVETTESFDTLVNVERVQYADTNLALDIDGNAGDVAKIIGAVFGAEKLEDAALVGLGIKFMDNGVDYKTLMSAALSAVGATTNEDAVYTLYTNIVGEDPSQEVANWYVSQLDAGRLTVGELAAFAGDSAANLANIDFVGLETSGLVYTEFEAA